MTQQMIDRLERQGLSNQATSAPGPDPDVHATRATRAGSSTITALPPPEPLPVEPAKSVEEPAKLQDLLRNSGLRPTRQRVALAALLFTGHDRHVTAEILHEEAVDSGERVSLATVYNTLHQFRGAGLLREIAIDGSKTYFDTNTSNHNHFFVETESRLVDIPGDTIQVSGVPAPPPGTEVVHVDVVIRLAKK